MSSQLLLFIIGNGMGMYIAQNYKVPDLKSWLSTTADMLKQIEEKSRKNS